MYMDFRDKYSLSLSTLKMLRIKDEMFALTPRVLLFLFHIFFILYPIYLEFSLFYSICFIYFI